MKSYRLKEDIIIPKGTVLECIDGRKTSYVNSMYEATIGLTKDTCGNFIYGIDLDDKEILNFFEEVECKTTT